MAHGINQVCPSCKAGSEIEGELTVERVTDPVILNRWGELRYTRTRADLKRSMAASMSYWLCVISYWSLYE